MNSPIVAMEMNPVVSFIVVATGEQYLDLADNLIASLDKFFEDDFEVHLFTDQKFMKLLLKRGSITVHRIESLKWPEASYKRFEIISGKPERFRASFIIYLDADMELVSPLKLADFNNGSKATFFVRHPGDYKRGVFRNLIKRTVKPFWETRKGSNAYVPISKRRNYVYGAIWGGNHSEIISMCEQLAKNIELDIERDIYAVSYDESYLNEWTSRNPNFVLLSPEFAYAGELPWLKRIRNPKIRVVEKTLELVVEKKSLEKNDS